MLLAIPANMGFTFNSGALKGALVFIQLLTEFLPQVIAGDLAAWADFGHPHMHMYT